MEITGLGNIKVRNNTGKRISSGCDFKGRFVGITICKSGMVSITGQISTKLWVMHPAQRKELRSHLAHLLRLERIQQRKREFA